MKTIIIGGGLSGLASAYRMLKEDISEVTILERSSEVGGMAASYHIGNYHIEKYYHHIFKSDSELIHLADELGIGADLQWLKGTTGYHINGKIYPMTTPIELLKSPLSVLDLIRLARIVLMTRRARDEEIYKLDRVTAKEWILKNAGRSVYERFFEPLLRSKFGSSHDKVSAAWLFGRIRIRSNRSTSGEQLGYLRGGFHRLVTCLADSIVAMGGEIRTNCEASEIGIVDGSVSGVDAGRYMDCDSVISTVSPYALLRMVPDAPDISYQGTACALFGMNRSLMKDMYWLNIKSSVPFGAVIEHTNFLPLADYGEHLVYVTAYFQDDTDPRWQSSEQELIDSYLCGLEELFPDFHRDDVSWWRLARDIDTAPVYLTDYIKNIPPYATAIDGLYLAGMFSRTNYPERSMNGSILAGFGCAEEIRAHTRA
ncbi:MAG: hypothetical protein C5S49_02115 [Candidatus Methanogaster sp.]|nr:MAG: hypothetical protein C5S49_02115 [ANME-2 cluster archaeon]